MPSRFILHIAGILLFPLSLGAQSYTPPPDTCLSLLLKPATDIACGPGHGRAAFRVEGGSGQYSFLWSNGSTDSLQTQLMAGTYTATVTDQGCSTIDSIRIGFDRAAFPYRQSAYGNTEDNTPLMSTSSPDGQFFYTVGAASRPGFEVGALQGSIDIWLVKTDREGQLVWSKTYGASGADRGVAVLARNDGTIVLAASTNSSDGIFSDSANVWRPALLFVSGADGALLDVKVIDDGQHYLSIQKMIEAPNGDIVLAGNGYVDNSSNPPVWVARLDASGNLLWSNIYGNTAYLLRGDIVADPAGGYVLSCEIQGANNGQPPNINLFKIDENGAMQWYLDDWNVGRSKLYALPDGQFLAAHSRWVNGQYRPAITRFSSAGFDSTYTDATATQPFANMIPLQQGGWAMLVSNETNPVGSSVILIDSAFQFSAGSPLTLPEKLYGQSLFQLGTDSFYVVGKAPNGDLKLGDWTFSAFRLLLRDDNPLPVTDTLVCPGATVLPGIDGLAGMYDQFGCPTPDIPLPAQWTVGRQDTLLWCVARNAEGCEAGLGRRINIDQFRAKLEVESATCGQARGRIRIGTVNNAGLVQIQWSDGADSTLRTHLSPGLYPVTVSDGVCALHFTPEVEPGSAPEQGGYFIPPIGTLFTGYGWGSGAGKITALTDGTQVYYYPYAGKIRIDYITVPDYSFPSGFGHLVPLKDTTFAVVGLNAQNNRLLIFNRNGALVKQHDFPTGNLLIEVRSLDDGGYLALLQHSDNVVAYDLSPIVIRLDAQFQTLWTTTINDPDRQEYCRHLDLLPDGRIVVTVNSAEYTFSDKTMRLYWLDSSGAVLGSKWYGGEGQDEWLETTVTPDGDLIAASATNSISGDLDGQNMLGTTLLWLMRIDGQDGQLAWSRLLPNNSKISFRSDGAPLLSTDDSGLSNGFFPAGAERLTLFDPQNGDTIWSMQTSVGVGLNGYPFYTGGGDILWPHFWYENYNPGPAGHCCPFADFHLRVDVWRNGEMPQPFSLGPDTTLCIGDTLVVSAVSAQVPVTWQDFSNDTVRVITTAGVYTVKAGGVCALSDTIRIDYCLYPPLPDSLSGCAPLVIDGGMPGLAHSWSNGSLSQTVEATESGWLGLTVINLSGQLVHDSVYLSIPPVSSYETAESDISCFGASDGWISVTPSGDGAPYAYWWNGVPGDSSIANLPVGQYQLSVSDQYGCVFTGQFNLSSPSAWSINLQAYPNFDSSQYTLSAYAGPGLPLPASYLWSNGATTNHTIATGGPVSVTITDANGCVQSDTILLPETSGWSAVEPPASISAWPNPANNWFRVSGLPAVPGRWACFDALGRAVEVTPTAGPPSDWSHDFIISCEQWPQGVYTLLIQWEGGSAALSIIRVEP
ncbi:MAG: SprB repeat-containing protein [Saprospiraceae bacterium]